MNLFTGAGQGKPDVVVVDPKGSRDQVRPVVRPMGDETFRCDYVSTAAGQHAINVLYDGKHVPASPFRVDITPGMQWSRVLVKVIELCD